VWCRHEQTLVAVRADVVQHLRCPVCGTALKIADRSVRCAGRHSFDIARQGYVNLLTGPAPGGDTPEMVEARAAVLDAGHLDLVTEAIAAHAPGTGLAIDVGAGTGHHLAALLEPRPALLGLALDVSKAAARRAARAHPRLVAAVCDAWRGLPVADGCADLVLNVFAPRNGPEFRRVLRPDGRLIVVTPHPDHLGELVEALGLIGVDPDKDRRLDVALGRWFTTLDTTWYSRQLALAHRDVTRLVAMGPSAHHVERLPERVAALPEPVRVTTAVGVTVFTPKRLQ